MTKYSIYLHSQIEERSSELSELKELETDINMESRDENPKISFLKI